MPTIKQLSRIFSDDNSLNRLQDQLAAAFNPILRNVQGDLSGPLESPSVVALQGRSVSSVAPASGNALIWNGSQWVPGTAGSSPFITSVLPPLTVVSGVLSIPKADATTDGYLSAADWTAFDNKISNVTATSPLTATGILTRNIALTGVVAPTNGGTGLSSPGAINNVLTSNGTAWVSAPVPGGAPSGPAGGVLGYTGSSYPNPNGLAANVFGAPATAYIPIKGALDNLGAWKETQFRLDANSDLLGRCLSVRAGDAIAFTFVPFNGGVLSLYGGDGATNYSGGGGGSVNVIGGNGGSGNFPGGTVFIRGGNGSSGGGTGGSVDIRGGFDSSGTTGPFGDVDIGTGNTATVRIAALDVPTRLQGKTILTPKATQTITGATASFDPTRTYLPFDVTGGNHTLTSTPTILTAGASAGQLVVLHNVGATDHIKIDRGAAQALSLANPTQTINPGGSMVLVFDGTYWVEIAHITATSI